MEKWTKESAIKWMLDHKHKFLTNGKGGVSIRLNQSAGLTALSCADYLRKKVRVRIVFPLYPREVA